MSGSLFLDEAFQTDHMSLHFFLDPDFRDSRESRQSGKQDSDLLLEIPENLKRFLTFDRSFR